MWMIVGLGNPGKEYARTRHNVGFDVIDVLSETLHIPVNRLTMHGQVGEGFVGGEKVMLVKPQTYMNLSGQCVSEMVSFYKVPMERLLVIYDDIDLDPGQLRIRKQGSAGGHNGIKDLIQKLGTQKFVRIRVGVGAKPKDWDLADYVLGRFAAEDRKLVDEAQERACKAVEMILSDGPDAAMNEFNKKSGVV